MKKIYLEKSDPTASKIQVQEIAKISAIIQARDVEVSHISKQIHDIRDIYQELATLVDDQGSSIDKISGNLEATKITTEKGVTELKRAEQTKPNCLIQ